MYKDLLSLPYDSIFEILIKWNKYAISKETYSNKINILMKEATENSIDNQTFENLFLLLFPNDKLCSPGCVFPLSFFSSTDNQKECENLINIIALMNIPKLLELLKLFNKIFSPSKRNSFSIPGSSIPNINHYYVCLLMNDTNPDEKNYFEPSLILQSLIPPQEGNRFYKESSEGINIIRQLLPIEEVRTIRLLWGPFNDKKIAKSFKQSLFSKV